MLTEYESMSQPEIENIIIDGDNIKDLYRLNIFLERKATHLFHSLNEVKDPKEKNKLKDKLSWAQNLRKICEKREEELREDNNAFNWRFRLHAQSVLSEPLYTEIYHLALHKKT